MAGKGTRHRFELSRLEIAGVVVSATAGLFVVFLLGIYAGRGMSDRHLDGGEQIVRQAVAPAVEQTPGAEDGLTFYDTLGRPKSEERGGAEHRAAPPDEAVVASAVEHEGAKAAEPQQARNEKPEPPAKAEPAPKAEPPVKAEPPAKVEPPTTVAKEEPRQAPAAAPSPPKPEKAPTARVAVALAPATPPTPSPRAMKGDWSVQVSATRDPRTADTVLRRLRAKGYDAFVLKVRRRGETFYRVRVGHYGTLEEAQQIVTRLRREPGVPEAFVASD
jgi:cell division protein FtsN